MKKKILIVVAALILVGVGYYVWSININHNFKTISEGKVYKSGVIPPDQIEDYIKKYGIKSVVDLRRPGTNDLVNNPEVTPELVMEKKAVEAAGGNYFDVGSEQIPDQATLDRFYAVMDNPANYPVLIHCHHGEGRAPLFSAVYQIEYEGVPNEEARVNARTFLVEYSPFGEGKPKGEFLKNYKTRKDQQVALSK
jgi:protein tyrosine phosphatase (PTP) superfamily phosphohydrolase (DUF442 family)